MDATGSPSRRNHKETRESIIADMLGQNLKWAFLTILTCIEKSETYHQEKQEQTTANQNAEPGTGGSLPIMSDLVCFKNILTYL